MKQEKRLKSQKCCLSPQLSILVTTSINYNNKQHPQRKGVENYFSKTNSDLTLKTTPTREFSAQHN